MTPNITLILEKCDKYKLSITQRAYVLATVQHETGDTYEPVHEYGSNTYFTDMYENRLDLGNTQPGDGARYHGRGFAQITGRLNYTEYERILGKPLVSNPDLALDPEIAAEILVHGMINGIFTGRKLGQYVTDGNYDFVAARAVVNGNDRAELIAGYAEEWLEYLKAQPKIQPQSQESPVPSEETVSFVDALMKGLGAGVAVTLSKMMRQYKATDDQELLLDWLHLAIQKLDNTIIWRFARSYRNNEDGSDIDFCAVAEWYEGMPHQVKALNQLESDMSAHTDIRKAYEVFTQLWAIVSVESVEVKTDSGYQPVEEDADLNRLYQAMTHQGSRIPPDDSQEEGNINSMIEALLKLERHLGVKISLTSGYRPEPINSEVGGVPGSEHTKGNAADCYSEQMDDMEFEAKAAAYWKQHQLGGIGWGMSTRGFVHLDRAEVREWNY